jgi:hypothetical protein
MRLVGPGALVLASLAVVASAAPVRAQESVAGLPPGSYASRQYVSTRALTRPSNRYLRVRTTSLLLHRVRDTDEGLVVDTRFCSVEQEPLGKVRTTIGPGFVAAMPAWTSPVEIDAAADGPTVVRIPDHVMVLGANLDDPATEPLPDRADDPRVTDPDGDGNPGVSVEVAGLVNGQVYLVQRLVRGLRGTPGPDGRMAGAVTGTGEQRVIGASSAIIRSFTPQFEHNPDPKRNVFVWVPVPEDATCESVVAGRDILFGED